MATKLERIHVSDEDTEDSERLLKLCEEKTGCCESEILEWEERTRPHQLQEAPAKTIAVLVDTMGTGALRVYKEDDEYLGGVWKDTKTVFIPWNSKWRFFCSGTLRTKYITEKVE